MIITIAMVKGKEKMLEPQNAQINADCWQGKPTPPKRLSPQAGPSQATPYSSLADAEFSKELIEHGFVVHAAEDFAEGVEGVAEVGGEEFGGEEFGGGVGF